MLAELVELASTKYEPPPNSFNSRDYLKELRKRKPDATKEIARNHLDALMAAGKIKRTDEKYVISDPDESGGTLGYYYTYVVDDSKSKQENK